MKRLYRFLSLPSRDRHLLIKAALLLGVIRLGLWLLAFQTLQGLLLRIRWKSARLREADPLSLERIAWAIRVAGRYVPGVTCLIQALAAQVLLEQEGHPACLRIGVAKDKNGRLQAHAWTESGGKVVVGGGNLSSYTLLSTPAGKKL
ncbi:MAG TPA: lasso peptide biosynthesis B2 protein [Candidatus Limnocylindrales bacterium]|nr:lasso peptide biosynthesis B2 protein [Candidatus Limnocylindrales bacterium]